MSKHQARARQPARTVAAVSPLFAHGKRGPRYVVHYRFLDAAGIEHKGEGRVSVAFWQGTKAGDQVAVRYLRGDPASSKLESAVWEFWPAIPVAVLSPVVLAYALRLGGSGIRWVNRQVWLVRHGDAVPGRFTRAEVEYRGKRRKDAVCVLEYEYAAPELVTGNLEMREKPRPEWQTGAGLVILVDPWDPMSHAPDIFDARSADADRLFPNPAAVT